MEIKKIIIKLEHNKEKDVTRTRVFLDGSFTSLEVIGALSLATQSVIHNAHLDGIESLEHNAFLDVSTEARPLPTKE